jgi:hypothetical protein
MVADALDIVRVHAGQVGLEGDLRARRQAHHAVQLLRPRHAVGAHVPLPVAEARDALRLRQAALALPQLARRGLLLGDVVAQPLVAVDELLRGQLQAALQQQAVVLGLLVRGLDGGEEGRPLPRVRRRLAPAAQRLDLPPQQLVHPAALGQRSEMVVMVIVWLCSSQLARGAAGQISP